MTAINVNALGSIGNVSQSIPSKGKDKASVKEDFSLIMQQKTGGQNAGVQRTDQGEELIGKTGGRFEKREAPKARSLSEKNTEKPVDDRKIKPEDVEEIIAGAAQVLGITPEELQAALNQLNMDVADLADRNNAASLVLMLNGSEDISDMLVDNGMLEAFNGLNDFMTGVLEEAGMTGNEFRQFLNEAANGENVEEGVEILSEGEGAAAQEGVPEIVIEKQGTEESGTGTEDAGTGRGETAKTTGAGDNAMVEGFVRNLEMNVNEAEMTGENVTDVREIVYQVVERIKVSITPDNTSMEMRLNPENLGRVSINITSKAGVMTAQINTENRQAKEAIESQLQILKENIEAKGIKVEAVEVRISDFNLADSRNSESNSGEYEAEASGNGRRGRTGTVAAIDGNDIEEAETLKREVLLNSGSTVTYTA